MQYLVLSPLLHDHQPYAAGESVEMDLATALPLLALSVLGEPISGVTLQPGSPEGSATPPAEPPQALSNPPLDKGVQGEEAEILFPQLTNLNTASLEELMNLKFIGKSTAERIIAKRPYASLDEVRAKASLSLGQLSWSELLPLIEV